MQEIEDLYKRNSIEEEIYIFALEYSKNSYKRIK